MTNDTAELRQYYIMYGALYIAFILAVTFIGSLMGSGLGGFTVIIPFIAALVTAQRFVKIERRTPSDLERNALTIWSFIVFIIIGLALSVLQFMLRGGSADIIAQLQAEAGLQGVMIAIVFLLVMFAIVFFMMRWAYGGLIRKMSANILGK